MATAEFVDKDLSRLATSERTIARADANSATSIWAALASLKLTVTLLAMLILLVFFGTLAQVHHDVWYVVRRRLLPSLAGLGRVADAPHATRCIQAEQHCVERRILLPRWLPHWRSNGRQPDCRTQHAV